MYLLRRNSIVDPLRSFCPRNVALGNLLIFSAPLEYENKQRFRGANNKGMMVDFKRCPRSVKEQAPH